MNENSTNDAGLEKTAGNAGTEKKLPDWIIEGDKQEFDFFLSQFVKSLADGNRDWFGRVVGFSPDPDSPRKYLFSIGGREFPMDELFAVIESKELTFAFTEINPIDDDSYEPVSGDPFGSVRAELTATVEVVDESVSPPWEFSGKFKMQHLLKPTYQAYASSI